MDIDKEIALMNIKISSLVTGKYVIYVEAAEAGVIYWYHPCEIDIKTGRVFATMLNCQDVRTIMPANQHIITTNAAHPLIIQQYMDYVTNYIRPTRREMEKKFIELMMGSKKKDEETPEYSIFCENNDDDETKQ